MTEMLEANLTFKREEREGVVPVGSYLSDAAARLGLRPDQRCSPGENVHFCRLTVLEGGGLLSPRTARETEFLSAEGASDAERLACQARIEKPGDIVIMTTKKKEENAEAKAEEAAKEYSKEFAELPLEKKIAQLVQLEAIALGETVSFVINSPFLIFEKAIDVLAEFGLKKEEAGKKAARPAEHTASENGKPSDAEPANTGKEETPPAAE